MSKSLGFCWGLCWDSGVRSTVPDITINLQCDPRESHFTCLATSAAPSPPLSPLVHLDHKFLRTGMASFYMFAQCLAQRDLHSGDLRYHSHIVTQEVKDTLEPCYMQNLYYSEPEEFQSWKHLLPN